MRRVFGVRLKLRGKLVLTFLAVGLVLTSINVWSTRWLQLRGEVGRGTGQGLSVARSVVVEKHRGQLSFESQRGLGTTFEIRLPLG